MSVASPDSTEHSAAPSGHIAWREQLGAGLLLALVALLLAPTFARGLACGHDTLTHYYRIMQVALNAQAGAPFSLWSPDFMRGYGYAIYPYYAPLSYWGTAVISLLGLGPSAALRLTTWLTLWLAGWGSYNLGRRVYAPPGALLAALAYLFAPYLLYNATQRGAFPELFGLALLPWALVAGDLALARRAPRAIGLAALAFAPLALAHNIAPNFGFAMLLALALRHYHGGGWRGFWRALWPALAVIALTLALTAFFWLPAYIELDFTQSRRADSPFANWPRYEQHFVAWGDMVGWPSEPGDLALTNPPLRLALGVGTAVFALFTFLVHGVWPGKRPLLRRWVFVWALILGVSLFFASPTSAWFWRHLPLPEFVQLPFRFLGPASLGLALLAGGALADHRLSSGRPLTQAAAVALFLSGAALLSMSGWFWLYPPVCEPAGEITAVAIAQATQWDRAGNVEQWGGDSLGETLPRWVDALPDPDGLLPAYAEGRAINRLVLPETAVLRDWQPQANGDRYQLHLNQPATLTYRAFYLPYWRAMLNGQPAPLTPRPGDGLIQLEVPAGDVTLSLVFGLTPMRRTTLIFSGLAVMALLWLAQRPDQVYLPLAPPSHREWATMLLASGALVALFALVNGTNNRIHAARWQDGRFTGAQRPAQISFSGEFLYLGYIGPEEMAASETAVFTQYWTAQRAIGAPYRFQLRLADDVGRVWNLPPGRPADYTDLPGKPGWRQDGYARDAYELRLLPGTPPGSYWLEVSAFRSDTDISLIPQGAATGADPSQARVGRLFVRPGRWELDADNAALATYAPTPLEGIPGLTLVGWTLPNIAWRVGETAQLELLWSGEGAIGSQPARYTLRLLDERGQSALEQTWLVGDGYPTTEWPETAVARDQVRWRLPASLNEGEYTVALEAAGQTLRLGAWRVIAPSRNFGPPPEMAETADAPIGFARLAGYTLESENDGLRLTLLWQAMAETEGRYRVFVHLRQADGSILAQSDSEPQGWTRPTTGWLPGEYILDTHWLPLPPAALPADAQLLIGLYDPATGQRLGETLLTRFGD